MQVENPLFPLMQAWVERPRDYRQRTYRGLVVAGRTYTQAPGLHAAVNGLVEAVEVDGEPFASRAPILPEGKAGRHFRPAPPAQGEPNPGAAHTGYRRQKLRRNNDGAFYSNRMRAYPRASPLLPLRGVRLSSWKPHTRTT